MCGFAATNYSDPITSNKHCQNRGPDMTTAEKIRGVYYLHNLLHITGELTPQPLIKDDVVCVFNGEIYNYTSFFISNKLRLILRIFSNITFICVIWFN